MRDHQPLLINEFNGLWRRGDVESCPIDHFSDCKNVEYVQSGFQTRAGLEVFEVAGETVPNVVRIYMFNHQGTEGLLVLDDSGRIYHTANPIDPLTPILSIYGMTDFAFQQLNDRAYISPNDGSVGLEGEFVYVYDGEGNQAVKAAGSAPVDSDGALAAADGAAGFIEAGYHIFAVVYETDSGFLSKIGPDTLPALNAAGLKKANLTNVPVSSSSRVIARRIVATKAIDPLLYTTNTRGYQFFFVPDGIIHDNTTTTITVNFFDADLLEDASHLLDLFDEIPAGAVLGIYHNRLIVGAIFGEANDDPIDDESGNNSIAYVSSPGEPEAINEVDGLLVIPPDGKPLTNAQEYRDVLYIFKQSRTYSYTDNGDVPSSWPLIVIDDGVGASLHGIANVLDSGGTNVDYLLIADLSGIIQFNGSYTRPELTWKIRDLWNELALEDFNQIQMMNDSINQLLYIALPNRTLLFGNYQNGLNPQAIRWAPWDFDCKVNAIALININELVIGAEAALT